MTDGIDVLPVRAWARLAVRALDEASEPLDRANVFPVPDADTGTNLVLTLREGAAAIARTDGAADGPEAGAAFARGCLLGARGNSGVIVAAWVRALVEAWAAGPVVALERAARAARTAVGDPAAGTALSVADDAARAARAAGADAPLVVLGAACAGAREAVLRSPQELGPRGRGRLDAGAQGLRLVLGALAAACGATDPGLVRVVPDDDVPVSVADGTLEAGRRTWDGAVEEVPAVAATDRSDELEVMFTLDVPEPDEPGDAEDPAGPPDVAGAMRAALAGAGTSVAVVGGDGTWRGHVHTADPGAALEDAVRVAKDAGGRLRDVQVQDLTQPRAGGLGVVAVTSAPGLVVELARAGAVVLAHGRRRTPPGPSALRRALEEARGRVVLLVAPPGTPVPDAEEPVSGARGPVVVRVETPTDAHTVSALAALATLPHGPGGQAVDTPGTAPDLASLTAAAEATRDLVGAVRGAVLPTEWGSAVGVVEALVAAAAPSGAEAAGSGGVVVLVHGVRADEELVARVVEHVAARDPRAEVIVLPSGRDDAVVHVGVEPPPTGPGASRATGREGAA
ncbi:DAK2 domain-containing protein [Luteimicrobium sp. NPDC057192]|uniref:DAK2 domain-containing protein n=1 Tax=Luteimicrobium sp. NPDC057192 TaxID=3346042 RepID=UPI0036393653